MKKKSASRLTKTKMRIVLLGASKFGYQVCKKIIADGHRVAGIVTSTEKFKISYSKERVHNVLFADFNQIAQKERIPLVRVPKNFHDDKYFKVIKSWKPDLALVVGWYFMVPERIRALAKKGCIGIHHSLLPKYRGGAPLVWAMINGEKYAGTTLFFLEKGIDTGDIINQKKFRICKNDTIANVYEKASDLALKMIEESLPKIATGHLKRTPQDHSKATLFPQRSPRDGKINWSKSPEEIKNFIRAQTKPYPGAFTFIQNKKITIWDADIAIKNG